MSSALESQRSTAADAQDAFDAKLAGIRANGVAAGAGAPPAPNAPPPPAAPPAPPAAPPAPNAQTPPGTPPAATPPAAWTPGERLAWLKPEHISEAQRQEYVKNFQALEEEMAGLSTQAQTLENLLSDDQIPQFLDMPPDRFALANALLAEVDAGRISVDQAGRFAYQNGLTATPPPAAAPAGAPPGTPPGTAPPNGNAPMPPGYEQLVASNQAMQQQFNAIMETQLQAQADSRLSQFFAGHDQAKVHLKNATVGKKFFELIGFRQDGNGNMLPPLPYADAYQLAAKDLIFADMLTKAKAAPPAAPESGGQPGTPPAGPQGDLRQRIAARMRQQGLDVSDQ